MLLSRVRSSVLCNALLSDWQYDTGICKDLVPEWEYLSYVCVFTHSHALSRNLPLLWGWMRAALIAAWWTPLLKHSTGNVLSGSADRCNERTINVRAAVMQRSSRSGWKLMASGLAAMVPSLPGLWKQALTGTKLTWDTSKRPQRRYGDKGDK